MNDECLVILCHSDLFETYDQGSAAGPQDVDVLSWTFQDGDACI